MDRTFWIHARITFAFLTLLLCALLCRAAGEVNQEPTSQTATEPNPTAAGEVCVLSFFNKICPTGKCIGFYDKCDPGPSPIGGIECGSLGHLCKDGSCIHTLHDCRGNCSGMFEKQCEDNRCIKSWETCEISREACGFNEYSCNSGVPQCYHSNQRCDGYNYCADGTDEKSCSGDDGSNEEWDSEEGNNISLWFLLPVFLILVVIFGCKHKYQRMRQIQMQQNQPRPVLPVAPSHIQVSAGYPNMPNATQVNNNLVGGFMGYSPYPAAYPHQGEALPPPSYEEAQNYPAPPTAPKADVDLPSYESVCNSSGTQVNTHEATTAAAAALPTITYSSQL